MIYFDHAATSLPKPDNVVCAVAAALTNLGNATRGAHRPAFDAARTIFDARCALADLFDAESPDTVCFCQNTTMALNTAIAGVCGHIVTTAAEHNSVLRPVHRHGNYAIVPADELGRISPAAIAAAIQPDTAAVVMTHGSNLTGNLFDIAAVGQMCQERGIHFIVDAAQTAGLFPICMAEMHISALCFSGHKSLWGPQGVGGICLGRSFAPPSLLVGGSGSQSSSLAHPQQLPDVLEAGTQNSHGIAGLLAALPLVKRDMEQNRQAADTLARSFAEKVKILGGFTLYGDLNAPKRLPIVTLNHPSMNSAELTFFLADRYNIAVRAGLHCAPLMHKTLGTEQSGAVRFSFSHCNTMDEIDTAITALQEVTQAC